MNMACAHPIENLAKQATGFVVANKGTWGHEDWERFCAQVAASGIELNEHNEVALGNLLEAVRYFYQLSPVPAAVPKKKATTSRKAATKKSTPK
jgi:high-affinity K+ transport system ATPase subunit B